MKKSKLLFTLFFLVALSTIQAQQTVDASGGVASGSGGTVNYSVGQVVYTTNTGTTGSVAQGVQQPFEISVVLGVEEHQISLNIQAYPNPTTNFLTLNVGKAELSTFNFELYDISGKLIESKKITSTTETIRMENLPIAIYFLKISDSNKVIKTFKIIKK
ncbi:T9SS type A sorting domain-containing protein [Flavobacterium sp.]|uniref:T9SS type A sorting domain-containing protein n=1 Tax=Flavobacterium sp. TaxID=239 RepID=UPI0033428C4D